MKVLIFLVATVALLGIGIASYNWCEIPRSRIYGKYEIDRSFYAGENSDWQHKIYSFEITPENEFRFIEKNKDGSNKLTSREINWYRKSSPHLFRIVEANSPLIDEYPSHYRGKCKFYFVFETKFGNMFYRKLSS